MDVEGAYRTIPVKPDHKRFVIARFRNDYYIDHNVPFGICSAHGLQGEVADATVDILYSLGIHPIIKWVDDFNLFRFPSDSGTFSASEFPNLRYNYDLPHIKNLIAPLNIPWHYKKGQDFNSLFPYLEWDLKIRTVAIPESKRIKHLSRLTSFFTKCNTHEVVKNNLQKINGSLSHLSFVLQRGRSHLSNLFLWLKSFPNEFTHRWPPPSVTTDIKWWLQALEHPPLIRYLQPPTIPTDLDIWIDASTSWGIGLLFSGKWDAWQLADDWEGTNWNINWLEAIAVEFIIGTLISNG
jgi:hypothetical protein